MRILLKILGVLLLLVVVAATVVFILSSQRKGQTYTAPPVALAVVSSDSAQARGRYLASIMGCHECHGADLGGKLMADAPPFRIAPPNLTSGEGGVGGRYDAAAWERAVRHAIAPDGRGLYIMPSSAYRHLSDADMAALVAYLQAVPPVDGAHPGVVLKPLGRALVAFGAFRPEVVEEAVRVPGAPPAGVTAAYGEYLASITCMHCHGATLQGGPNPDPAGKPVPALGAAAQWTAAQFAQAVREGVTPDGRHLDPAQMPWPAFAALTDTDVQALRAFARQLGGLPADAPAADTSAAS